MSHSDRVLCLSRCLKNSHRRSCVATNEDYGREKDGRVIIDGEGADIPTQSGPEKATKNVLDFMVASLAQRSVAAARGQRARLRGGAGPGRLRCALSHMGVCLFLELFR